jgi:hypothetical protein
MTLRRPANPIGWLYAASALIWSLIIPLDPWLDQLVRDQLPLSLLAELTAVAEVTVWAPAIAVLGVTVPLAAAAAFQPLPRRVQDLVDRRFNRRRYDATRTVEGSRPACATRVDLDTLHGELLAVVDHTVQPTSTSLWLRPPATS